MGFELSEEMIAHDQLVAEIGYVFDFDFAEDWVVSCTVAVPSGSHPELAVEVYDHGLPAVKLDAGLKGSVVEVVVARFDLVEETDLGIEFAAEPVDAGFALAVALELIAPDGLAVRVDLELEASVAVDMAAHRQVVVVVDAGSDLAAEVALARKVAGRVNGSLKGFVAEDSVAHCGFVVEADAGFDPSPKAHF